MAMFVVSLQKLAEQVVNETKAEKALSGNVANLDVLFEAQNLELLESRFNAFAFWAFDGRVDKACVKYLEEGTLAADSGAQLLILFTTSQPTPVPSELNAETLSWMDLDEDVLPAQEMLRHLFVPNAPPALPGIAFLRKFSTGDETIYFPLGDYSDSAALRQYLREIFTEVSTAAQDANTAREFIDKLAVASQLHKRKFRRGSVSSPRQWLITGYRSVKANSGDLISAIGLLV